MHLRNVLGSFRKSLEIVRSSSETLTLCRIKISSLWLRKSWQVYRKLSLQFAIESERVSVLVGDGFGFNVLETKIKGSCSFKHVSWDQDFNQKGV